MNIANVPVLFSTVLSLVILSLRHQTGFEGGVKYGGGLVKKSKKSAAALIDTRRLLEN
jgi:hypothetical protein